MGRPRIHPLVPGEPLIERQRRIARERAERMRRAAGARIWAREWLPGETAESRTKRLNAEKSARYRSRMTPEDRESAKATNRAWYKSHPEYAREWRAKNPDKVYESTKRYKQAHPEKVRAVFTAWRTKNIDHARAWSRENLKKRYATDADFRFRIKSVRHARRANEAGGTLTRDQWSAILEYFGHRCAYCLKPADSIEMDHVVALSKGGRHSDDNVVPACRSCNARKNNRGVLSMLGKAA